MPTPDVPIAPAIPGVSRPEQGPDRYMEMAKLMGQRQGNDAVSAMEKISLAIADLREAAAMEPRVADIVQKAIMLLTGGPGQAPMQPGAIAGPIPPGIGMGGPSMPPGIM